MMLNELKKENQVKIKLCTEMLREAFWQLRLTERYYGLTHKQVDYYHWNSLIARLRLCFFNQFGMRYVVPANITNCIRDIEAIRQRIIEEEINK